MIDFQSPDLLNKYICFDNLIQTINIFASSQDYAVIEKKIKVSKKRILWKTILMYN